MARFCSLFSSSKGNSTILSGGSTQILIDAGVSCKRLSDALFKRGIDPEKIDAVFVTHDHSDHVSGIKVFCGKYGIPVYATEKTISSLDRSGILNGKFDAYNVIPGEKIRIGDLCVTATPTPHDREGSCCFTVEFPDERIASIVTDLGHVTAEIHDSIKESDLVLLESNHDYRMLMAGMYPFEVKKRIADPEKGHLTNEECAEECAALFREGRVTRFFLGHISENNNHPRLVYATTEAALKAAGAKIGVDCLLDLCKPEGDMKITRF